jgi:trehalose/maltose transport system permease protein
MSAVGLVETEKLLWVWKYMRFPRRGRKSRRYTITLSRVLFYPVVFLIWVYILFPFYWALRSALSPDSELFATPVQYFPRHPTLSNFRLVLNDANFTRALLNSGIVAFAVTVIGLALGGVAAYPLGRFRFRGRRPVMYLVLSMTMFPQIAILGALWNMVNQFGLYDHLYALVLVYLLTTLPFTVWVLMVFFRVMPVDLEEAAYIDGASPFQTFWKIMLPLAAPGMATAGVLALISAWNEFLFAVSFLQSPENRTVPVAMYYFQPQANVGDFYITPWGQVMAATVVATVPLVVLTLILQRRIVSGLTGGALTG